MSSSKTHMIIGGVCGLGLARLVDTQGMVLPGVLNHAYGLTAALIAGSALLATLPDIDEPNSWIARNIRSVIILAAGIAGGLLGWNAAAQGRLAWSPWIAAAAALCVSLVAVGPLLSLLVLRLIQRASGGHRRMTHSLVVAATLAIIAVMLWRGGSQIWAAVPAALAYSIVVHVIGDIVTPAGVPLWYPLSTRAVGLPRPLSSFGEPLILLGAVGTGLLLIRGW